MSGKYLGEWPLGRTYAVQVEGDAVWATMQPIDLPVPSPGWMVKLDRKTGKVLGSVESDGLHSIAVTKSGELMTGAVKMCIRDSVCTMKFALITPLSETCTGTDPEMAFGGVSMFTCVGLM